MPHTPPGHWGLGISISVSSVTSVFQSLFYRSLEKGRGLTQAEELCVDSCWRGRVGLFEGRSSTLQWKAKQPSMHTWAAKLYSPD